MTSNRKGGSRTDAARRCVCRRNSVFRAGKCSSSVKGTCSSCVRSRPDGMTSLPASTSCRRISSKTARTNLRKNGSCFNGIPARHLHLQLHPEVTAAIGEGQVRGGRTRHLVHLRRDARRAVLRGGRPSQQGGDTERDRRLHDRLTVLAWDEAAADHYGAILAILEKKGRVIGAMDMLIAAHARSIKAVLVTNDLRHLKKVPGIKVEDWS